MASGPAAIPRETPIHTLGRLVILIVETAGDLTLFALAMLRGLFAGWPRRSVVLTNMYQIGVQSIPVVAVTGGFIGMVLAVQTFDQLRLMRIESRIGSVINLSLVRELGPVLAATMLAGRVGSSMAAEIGTMRVTEQIDALRALGANPIHYLVAPRFLACFLLIPLLTVVADGVGMLGGWFFSVKVLGVDSFYYWHYTFGFVTAYDIMSGLVKSALFGASIGIIACHRGFNCGAGAEGVGRAATEAFVLGFMAILVIDLFLGIVLNAMYYVLWPAPIGLV